MKIKLNKKIQIILILFAIFMMMFALNHATPLLADDYIYSFNWANNERVGSILDIINSQIKHYQIWSGRFIAHMIAQLFLMFPKTVFNILNSIMYVLLIYFIYMHSKNKGEEKPLLLVLIHLSIFFLTPVFGQNCIWLTGSCNYLWTTVLILSLLLFYRKDYKLKDNIITCIFFFLFGILAGCTNENTSVGLIVIMILSMIIYKVRSKYQISGLIGAVIGFLFMILAPGNYIRYDSYNNSSLITRFFNISINFIDLLGIMIIILIVLLTIYIYNKKKIEERVIVYLIGAFITSYSMCLSPLFPLRAWFGVVIFLNITIMSLIYNVNNVHKIFNVIMIDVALIFSVLYVSNYFHLLSDTLKLNAVWEERIRIIKEGKEKGQLDFYFKPYNSLNKRSPQYDLYDIGKSEYNSTYYLEKYYGINSIDAINSDE